MHKPIILTIIICSLFIVPVLGAQEQIALHPFFGPEEAESIATASFQRIQRDFINLAEGKYMGFVINLSFLPQDVPEGGFPPWICPSPSITGGSPYAITGEVTPDQDNPDEFRLRLYLWRMEGARLLGSDEMTITGPDDLDNLPFFMEWVLSWIEEDEPPEPVVIYIDSGPVPYQQRWLYLGLRGGGGYSQWAYDLGGNYADEISRFMSANVSFQAALRLMQYFEIQSEVNLVSDININAVDKLEPKSKEGTYVSFNLKIPLLAKLVFQGDHLKAGIFGGAYLYIPLTQMGNNVSKDYYKYSPTPPGFLFGLSIGWRLGPGNLFLDGRLEHDGRWGQRSHYNEIYYRNSVRFNIGYELGFFPKRPRE